VGQIIDESAGFLPAGYESDLSAELGDVFDPFWFDREEDVSSGQEEESRIPALARPLARRERPPSAALGRPLTPSVVAIPEVEGARAAPVAEEERPPRKDTATMTIDQPIVALPTGWSLRRLAEVAGRHVGRTIREIEEREFGPIADLYYTAFALCSAESVTYLVANASTHVNCVRKLIISEVSQLHCYLNQLMMAKIPALALVIGVVVG